MTSFVLLRASDGAGGHDLAEIIATTRQIGEQCERAQEFEEPVVVQSGEKVAFEARVRQVFFIGDRAFVRIEPLIGAG